MSLMREGQSAKTIKELMGRTRWRFLLQWPQGWLFLSLAEMLRAVLGRLVPGIPPDGQKR